ncbi:hypothetical protein ECH_0254 [Ehrlichia chaffeensis str. Arkansas]|uniref:Uncharacterized protein n=1 Tax=Ehrlichia chaffeensis (strain ATCC CRL-10679 / Arkansas) TaxID=205920 RepID=Q2GHK8_EHRCR|nr:hypothetical protein ECH_0254 [Ehrlichia chaffeensis str. Arkansas]
MSSAVSLEGVVIFDNVPCVVVSAPVGFVVKFVSFVIIFYLIE